MKNLLPTIALLAISTLSFGQAGKLWKNTAQKSDAVVFENKQKISSPQLVELDIELLKRKLNNSPKRFSGNSGVLVSFPNSDGNQENFRVQESSNMDPELAARYPEIKSYVGKGVENPMSTIYFSVSPLGLQSMVVKSDNSAEFIEPYTTDLSTYTVFKKSDKSTSLDSFECRLIENAHQDQQSTSYARPNADDGMLRNFRLALSVTGEYTVRFGGTKALALAAMNNTMTRVNGIFERDFGIHMNLIANNDALIYTSAATDPYSASNIGTLKANVGTTIGWNLQLQNTLTSIIGNANYDIGHLFGASGGGGNAGCIACVCRNPTTTLPIGKGSGFTSPSDGVPQGDNFDIDYVAHEMGHQFGASHTFTYKVEGTVAQVEPGSGSTVMSYAGIAGTYNVQAHSDPYFHGISIQQVTNYVKTTTCQTTVNTGNAVPVVNAGLDYTIPKGTPFMLTGSATDANNDNLTYNWEEIDRGNTASTKPSASLAFGPAFRSYPPTTSKVRYFPRLETIKTGATAWTWEAMPTVARSMNFRLTVRDNKAYGAANNSDDVVIIVNGIAGPFLVTSPNSAVSYAAGSTQTIKWNVAGTTANGVNAANVDILLSKDGGNTYPVTLLANTPNDGSQAIVIPNAPGTQNRIMVKGSNHIFFDISDANFTISGNAAAIILPSAPESLAAADITMTSTKLSWAAPTNGVAVSTYEVYQNGALKTSVSGTTTSIAGLAVASSNNFYVKAKDASGNFSAASNTLTVTTLADTAVPTTPATLAATATTQTTTNLSWTASTDNIGVTGYNVYQNGTLKTTVSTTSYAVTGLTARTAYTFNVKAKDAAGNVSASSNTVTVNTLATPDTTAPTAPTTLAASGTSQTTTSLSWTASTDNFAVTAYDVYMNGTLKATVATTSYAVTGLSAQTAYNFFVKAKDAAGNVSASSNTITVNTLVASDTTAPSAPTLTASGTSQTTTNLSWTASTDNVEVTSYDLYINGSWKTNITRTSFAAVGLTVQTAYNFYVKAKDAAGNSSAPSNTITVNTLPAADITAPTAPNTLTASGTSQTSTRLAWKASTDNIGVTAYNVYLNGSLRTTVSTTSYSVTGLTESTNYSFSVKAKDAAGNLSAASNTLNVTTLAEPASTISPYCVSGGNASSEKIARVTLGTLNNSSSSTEGYEDFTSIVTNVIRGTNYAVSITPFWTTSQYNVAYAVFIDYNDNGDFTDAGERVISKAPSQTSPLVATFTIPAGTSPGLKRMRVMMKRNALPSPCETFAYGQVEDYTLNILSASKNESESDTEVTAATDLKKLDFKLYPNPVKGGDLNVSGVETGTYRIINLLGQEVAKGTLEGERIQVGDVAAGTYLLEVTSENQTLVKRFIKQ